MPDALAQDTDDDFCNALLEGTLNLDAAAELFPGERVSPDGNKRDRILERLERRKGGHPL